MYWDLQKFYDSIDVSHLLRLGAERRFPMRVAVVDLQVHLGLRALRWAGAFCQATDRGKQHSDGQQVWHCVCEKKTVRYPGGGSQVGAVGQG